MPLPHILLALAVVAVWGTNFVVIRWGLDGLPPLLFAALRFAASALPWLLFVPRPRVRWQTQAAFGVLLGVGQFGLLFLAIQGHISPGLASLVVQMQVFFTIGLSLWLTKYYVNEFGLGIQTAALLAACFSLPGGVLRAIGGMLSDKFGAHQVTWWVMWVSWICLFLLSYPQTSFTVLTANGPASFDIGLNVYAFTALVFVLGVCWAFGKASVFKYISDDYPTNIGAISGVVGLAGGLGGFILPILFGALMDFTGLRSSAFMLLYGVVWVSLIWMYWTEVRKTHVFGAQAAQIA